MSVSKLIKEVMTTLLAEFEAKTRFKICVSPSNAKRGKALTDKLLGITVIQSN